MFVHKLQIYKLSPAHGEKGGNIKMKNERLIRARIQCGYTQSEIAAKAKISLRAYQNYESGRRCPNVSVARLISQELNVPMDELF